jgi:putative protease
MNELLAPVGSKEAFYAAIANGADAVYLGLSKHNARVYADNFTLENLKEYVDFAHLRNVRVFVTLNTIVYDHELEEVYQMIDELAALHVDAIITINDEQKI